MVVPGNHSPNPGNYAQLSRFPWQVDLVDFQSIKDGPYCFLLTYKDDGTKFGDNAALTSKNAYAVALALLDMWATLGPPGILSCDNGGEFKALGKNVSKASNVALTDEVHATLYSTPSLAPLHSPPPPPLTLVHG